MESYIKYNLSILVQSSISLKYIRWYQNVQSHFYTKIINLESYFPIGVLQFKLFIFAVWVLDWVRVRVEFNLNQRRKLESRGGTYTLIKKHSFGVWKPSNDGTVLLEIYNLLTLQGIRPCRKINNFYSEVHALLSLHFLSHAKSKLKIFMIFN